MPTSWRVRLSYAIGHVLNDLCASVWFTYTLVFFKFGITFPTTLAGSIVLIGQLADGLATPLVGFFSDRNSVHSDPIIEEYSSLDDSVRDTSVWVRMRQPICRCFAWYPRGRKAWHLSGSLLVIFSFPLLYGSPIGSMNASIWAKMLFYTPIAIIFQIGWASVQISHLAIMNDLSLDSGERTLLTSLRYLSTVLSNLTVYLATFFLLKNTSHISPPHNETRSIIDETKSISDHLPYFVHSGYTLLSGDAKENIDFGKDDLPVFRYLALGIVAIGSLATIGFHIGVRRSDFLDQVNIATRGMQSGDAQNLRRTVPIQSFKDWLHLPLFWIEGFLYMSVRVIVNVSQAYITVYLLHSLRLPKNNMALVPLTIYLTSICSLLLQKPIQDRISRELNMVGGFLLVTCFCILVNYPGTPAVLSRVYISAGFLGMGCTIILVTALAMVSDLIGPNQNLGAFVYGYMSFTDKLANGIVIQISESLWNRFPCPRYYQNIESYGIGSWVVVGLIFLAIHTVLKRRIRQQYQPISLA